MSFSFTKKEKTLKRHSVDWILSQAKSILIEIHGFKSVCIDNCPKNKTAMYTTEEASFIIQDILCDSIFFNSQGD